MAGFNENHVSTVVRSAFNSLAATAIGADDFSVFASNSVPSIVEIIIVASAGALSAATP